MSSFDPKLPCTFLQLPLDIRNQVYELLFFGGEQRETGGLNLTMGEFEARKLNYASTGLCSTAVNQIHPYRRDSKYQPQYDLSIFRTNHQIQEEAERVFYGWSSFNLTCDLFVHGDLPTFQFFETLPRRIRKLIRRVEMRCFYRSTHRCDSGNVRLLSLFDWRALMKLLASECPSLRSLTLWGFADGVEGDDLAKSCRIDSDWVQSLLQIKTLQFFDIRAIPRRRITRDQSCVPEFLLELRSLLYRQPSQTSSSEVSRSRVPPGTGSTFPFRQLPLHIRKRIYSLVFLPEGGHLHPFLKPWYDVTTRNVVPLFLTCRQIRTEAEQVLYGEGIFCAPTPKYDQPLREFIRNLPPRLSRMVRHKITYKKLISPFDDFAMRIRGQAIAEYFYRANRDDWSHCYTFTTTDPAKSRPLMKMHIVTSDLATLRPFMRDWISQGYMDLASDGTDRVALRLQGEPSDS